MKKTIFITIIFLFCISITNAQDKTKSDSTETYLKNYIYLNPVQPIFFTFQLGYERALNHNKHSVLVCLGYYREEYNSKIITGFSEELQYRFFLSSDESNQLNKFDFDFYLGPYFNHKFYKYDTDIYDTHNIIFGVIGGLRLSYRNFAFDIHAGGGFKNIYTNVENITYNGYHEFSDIGYTGILPKLGVQIGYKF